LTLAEYEASPHNARPTVGAVGGAIAMNAAVSQKAFVAGATLSYAINDRWSYSNTLYGAFTALENPTLRNYGRSSEPHAGGRGVLKYKKHFQQGGRAPGSIEWLIGVEGQQGLAGTQVYSTSAGKPDTLQSDDKLHTRSVIAFTQGALQWRKWIVTASVSINNLRVRYARLSNRPYTETLRDFNNEAAPRIAVSYALNPSTSIYGSMARGFSAPTGAELSPSGDVLNTGLQAEYGWNYESGLRGSLLNQRLSYDLALYYFSLANTIVQRRDVAGGDYFINSGSTRQAGAELGLRYRMIVPERSRVGAVTAFAAYSFQHYRYKDFRQLDVDYSGNALPGVSPHTISAGVDWESHLGLYARLNYYYSDAAPLNDAGSASLDAFQLFGGRVGYKMPGHRHYGWELFAGAENLADVRYSAGPDINAFGGRHYNAAPGRSFYAGISLQLAR